MLIFRLSHIIAIVKIGGDSCVFWPFWCINIEDIVIFLHKLFKKRRKKLRKYRQCGECGRIRVRRGRWWLPLEAIIKKG